ncbi:MAG: hypothetical protein NTV06_04905, partial [candidate division Zixibacteria bacterium]|nr:hypothetical protein [candidate division Zixibacteria bacterium]
MSSLSTSAKTTATKEEMLRIKEAIIGDPRLISGGEYVNRGFSGDVGRLPANLEELVRQGSLATYDKFTRIGWNGPYLDSSKDDDGYYLFLFDAWGDDYAYDSTARTISSLVGLPNPGGKTATVIRF